jgi:ribosomal protein L11 methylase PrmA
LALEQLDSARRDVDAERPDVDRQSGGRQSGGRQPASRQKSRPLDARPPDGATTQRGLSGARVLDVGSGTGVLGVAALLLDSSASLVAVDVDPAAIAATRRTAELNAVDERLIEVSRRSVGDVSTEHGPFDVVFANLLIPIIEELGPSLAAALAPGAHLVMSGLLSDPETGQVGRAIGAVQGARLEVAGVHEAQGWAAVVFRRTVPAI